MTKPTVKGGLVPANAVVCEGKGMRGCIGGHSPGQTGCRDASPKGETLSTLTIRGDQFAFRVATDAPCDGEQGIGQLTSG